jgi:hypothetical protein
MPIFHNIRKKLADENRFIKYSRYAVGEIFLVVIGILIALQINNWNEGRKIKNLEKQFLKRLRSDLVLDTIYYSHRIIESDTVMHFHQNIIRKMLERQEDMNEFKSLLRGLGLTSEHLTTRNSTYVEMLNSGNLNIIENEILKNDLLNYYLENEQAAKHIKEFNEFSVLSLLSTIELIPGIGRVLEFNKNLYDGMDLKFEDWTFINEPYSREYQSLENTIVVYLNKNKIFSSYFNLLKKESVCLIETIDSELEP